VIKPVKAAVARATFETLIVPIREAARTKGYAIAVHGSVARDIDLVAVPWTEEAVSAQELVAELLRAVQEATKAAGHEEGYIGHEGDGSVSLLGTKKPHGRRAWTIHVDGTYLDLSVMPRSST